MKATALERLIDKVVECDGCWLWLGRIDRRGYGRFKFDGRMALAYRVAYELIVGPVPPGLELDHLCRNRACVNPVHLEPVTPRENQIRGNSFTGINARKTHCLRGHPFDEENTYIQAGRRQCRVCGRDAARRYRKRRSTA